MADQEHRSASRTAGRIALLIGSYLGPLLVEAVRYLGRIALDLIYAIRVLVLNLTHRRPEQAPQLDSAVARLKEERSKSWSSWKTIPFRRQVEVRAASALLALIAVLAGRAYLTATSEETVPSPHARPISMSIAPSPAVHEQTADDFAKLRRKAAPGEWLLYSRDVLERGEIGQWDDFTVKSPDVLRHGRQLRMWYVGCHLLGDEHTCGVGYATSSDGVSWNEDTDPVLELEPSDGLNALAVAETPDGFLMWYALTPDSFEKRDCATLNLATSPDGLHFETKGTVVRANCNNTREIEPSVLYDSKVFHLWYFDNEAAALAHFTSPDGRHWQRAGSTALAALDQGFGGHVLGNSLGRISVIPDASGGYHGLFAFPLHGSRGFFGVLQSSDGNVWKPANDSPALGANTLSPGTETPVALLDSDGVWMWFAARNNDGSDAIQLAFRKGAW